jgi:predicted Zn-dependent peptidase
MTAAPARPRVGPPAPWSFPAPVLGQLPNGVRVVAFDVPGAQLAAVSIVVDAPLAAEPPDREGVATIVANTLDEGTAGLTGEQFSDEVALLGADYGASAGRSATYLTLDVATTSLAAGLALVAEALTSPAFPAAEVSRHVALRLAAIAHQDSVASIRAARALDAACFAPTSRASRPGGGTAATVGRVTRDDTAAWYACAFAPHRTTVVLAADLRGTDPLTMLDAALGGWSGLDAALGGWSGGPPGAGGAGTPDGAAARAGDLAAAKAAPPAVTVVDRPGSVQSALALGLAGPDRSAADWPGLLVAAHALGGGLSSRLMRSLREDLGYTYGIGARFTPFRAGGQFTISTAVDTATTGPALEQIRVVVDGLRDDGLTSAERDDAVEFYLGASPLRFQTARALVDQAAGLVGDGMPADWLNVLRSTIPRVTTEGASAGFAAAVSSQLAVVVVGDASVVAEPVHALGLGELTVVPASNPA